MTSALVLFLYSTKIDAEINMWLATLQQISRLPDIISASGMLSRADKITHSSLMTSPRLLSQPITCLS